MMEENILYVEDEPDYQSLVQEILGEAGFRTDVAGTGQEGLTLMGARKPRLLILDFNLPDMDGYLLCQRVRQAPAWSGLPILALTVRRRPEEWLRGFSCGASDYMAKPFTPPELIGRVKSCLSRPLEPLDGRHPEYRLAQAVLAGNKAAFGILSERYREPLIRKLRSLVTNREAAEDIVSDAFVNALEHL
jgi:DNA-binding response OmpR family regulator